MKKLIRDSLIKIHRSPYSFYEAVLWYFALGGKVRKKDVERYLGRWALKSGPTGNGWLSYIYNQAQSCDQVVIGIIYELMLATSVEDIGDEQDLICELFSIFQSLHEKSPAQRLFLLIEAENEQNISPDKIKGSLDNILKNKIFNSEKDIFIYLDHYVRMCRDQLNNLTETLILDQLWEYQFNDHFSFEIKPYMNHGNNYNSL